VRIAAREARLPSRDVTHHPKEMAGELERVQKPMRDLQKSLKSLPRNPLPKDVHKLRTATRHVEAIAIALPATDRKESRRLIKSLEPVRKAAGGVRDMDVLTSNARRLAQHSKSASLTQLVELLQTARQQNAVELRRALSHRRKAARRRLKKYSRAILSELAPTESNPPGANQNGRVNESANTVAMKCARELSEWPALDASNIHEFRLKVKQLRYILQLFADADSDFVGALGDVQRRVGDWHDWHQLEEIARAVFAADQDNALVGRIAEIAKRKLEQALAAANALRRRYLRTAIPHAPGC
jgi:CHAD domain-containing protein